MGINTTGVVFNSKINDDRKQPRLAACVSRYTDTDRGDNSHIGQTKNISSNSIVYITSSKLQSVEDNPSFINNEAPLHNIKARLKVEVTFILRQKRIKQKHLRECSHL